MVIEAASHRRSGGTQSDRAAWTQALLTQFRADIAGAIEGDREAKRRLENILMNVQRRASENPFVSCSLSYNVARSFANIGDDAGYILTIEGPWFVGIDFEFIRNLFGLYTGGWDYLQEYGIPERLRPPFNIVRIERAENPWGPAVPISP